MFVAAYSDSRFQFSLDLRSCLTRVSGFVSISGFHFFNSFLCFSPQCRERGSDRSSIFRTAPLSSCLPLFVCFPFCGGVIEWCSSVQQSKVPLRMHKQSAVAHAESGSFSFIASVVLRRTTAFWPGDPAASIEAAVKQTVPAHRLIRLLGPHAFSPIYFSLGSPLYLRSGVRPSYSLHCVRRFADIPVVVTTATSSVGW